MGKDQGRQCGNVDPMPRMSAGKGVRLSCAHPARCGGAGESQSDLGRMAVHRAAPLLLLFLLFASPPNADAQFSFGNVLNSLFRPIMRPLDNFLRPINTGLRDIFRFGRPATNANFRAEGRDKLFPDDCGRLDNGKGALCFGDPALCRASKSCVLHPAS